MARRLAIAALVVCLALPLAGRADGVYSYVDASGVIHVTNVAGRGDARAPVRVQSGAGRVAHGDSYDDFIRAAAEKYRLAPPLLKAVMAVESNFNPAAVSEKGATGLMQLMPATARDMYVSDIFDAAQNIEGGARYLRVLQDRFGGDLEKVLAAYNAGPERVLRHGGAIPPIPETQAYVRKVLALYDAYLRTN
jgi:soluble lytic murein transglycosylase-like protein